METRAQLWKEYTPYRMLYQVDDAAMIEAYDPPYFGAANAVQPIVARIRLRGDHEHFVDREGTAWRHHFQRNRFDRIEPGTSPGEFGPWLDLVREAGFIFPGDAS